MDPAIWLRNNVHKSGNKTLKKLAELIEVDGDIRSQWDYVDKARETARIIKSIIKNSAKVAIQDLLMTIPLEEIRDQCIKTLPYIKQSLKALKGILKGVLELIIEKKMFIVFAVLTCTISNFIYIYGEISNASNIREQSKGAIEKVKNLIHEMNDKLDEISYWKNEYNSSKDKEEKKAIANKIQLILPNLNGLHSKAALELSKVEAVIDGSIQSFAFLKGSCIALTCVCVGVGLGAGAYALAFAANPVVGLAAAVGFLALGAVHGIGIVITKEKIKEMEEELEKIKGLKSILEKIDQQLKEDREWLSEALDDLYDLRPYKK